jgi:hypothetical protein
MKAWLGFVVAAIASGAAVPSAFAQAAPLLYQVFLVDGTALSSFGEWARVDDRLVFSIPLTVTPDASRLQLVSLPVQRVDLPRTEQYAEAVRAATYVAHRGEADFARLSDEVARALNEIAIIPEPAQRLAAAERARRALADWPASHYSYRAAEVSEIMGVLDEVIAGLRASAGLPRFDLALATTTTEPPGILLASPPDDQEVVQQLMKASEAVTSPAERISLLQSVIALLDRAITALPKAFSTTIRAAALGGLQREQRIDAQYTRLRTATLADIGRYSRQADVRGLERVRRRLRTQDARLGSARPDDVAALLSVLDTELDAAHRLRLAHDQWLLRVDRLRAYEEAAQPFVDTLAQSSVSLDDIRTLAGPEPHRLRPLAQRLDRGARRLALVQPPAELAAVHAVLQSAYSLAENAVKLRLDAAQAADVDLARQAASAASGSMMLLERARVDLQSALQSPVAGRPGARP